MISIKAPAKINLYLHVTGVRHDGYHLLTSLIAFADVCDEIAIDRGDKLSLQIDGEFADNLPPNDENMVTQAAILLADTLGVEPAVKIFLTKNLPVASGIGGGSLDAAATLMGLCQYWKHTPKKHLLLQLAKNLGADVPVCLFGRASFVSGIGDELVPAPKLPTGWLVLVNPGVPVSTSKVFKRYQKKFSTPVKFVQSPKNTSEFVEQLLDSSNDLTEAATAEAPIISEVIKSIQSCKGSLLTRLSGSGATCFGLFEHHTDANVAALSLTEKNPRWWVRAAPLLNSWKQI